MGQAGLLFKGSCLTLGHAQLRFGWYQLGPFPVSQAHSHFGRSALLDGIPYVRHSSTLGRYPPVCGGSAFRITSDIAV